MRARVDALYLEEDLMHDPEHSDLLTRIASKYCLRTIRGKADAHFALANEPRTILVLDSTITHPDNEDIADELARLGWAGSTVILAGHFARADKDDLKRMLSKNLDLEWEYRGRGREVVGLRRDGIENKRGLSSGYALEAVMLGNVLPSSVWYEASVGGCMDQNAVAILGGYGEGRIGFVGDLNLEDETKKCLMAMLKAKDV